MFKITNNIEKFKPLMKEKWDIQGINAVATYIHAGPHCGIVGMTKILGYGYTKFMMQFKKDYLQLYYNRDDMHRCFDEFYRRYKKDKTYLLLLWDMENEASHDMFEYINYIKPRIQKLSMTELLKGYDKLFNLYSTQFNASHIIECIALTTDVKIKDMLLKELEKIDNENKNKNKAKKDNKTIDRFNEYFALLTQPSEMSFNVIYNNLISKAIDEINSDKKLKEFIMDKKLRETLSSEEIINKINEFNKFKIIIEKLVDDFYWMKTTWAGGKYLTKKEFVDEIYEYVKNNETFIYTNESKIKELERSKKEIMKLIKNNKELVSLIKITEFTAKWQDERKIRMLEGVLILQRFTTEISKRTDIKEEDLKYLLTQELDLLDENKLLENNNRDKIRKMLSERREKSGYLYLNNEMTIITGQDYDDFFKEFDLKNKKDVFKEISGMCASVGKVIGYVKVCKNIEDVKKLKKGDILVTSMTRPEFLQAMKKSAAIITDEGGLTCHAAIVSRELGKPCIIGTKFATKILKDGMLVEVNANHGVVKIL